MSGDGKRALRMKEALVREAKYAAVTVLIAYTLMLGIAVLVP